MKPSKRNAARAQAKAAKAAAGPPKVSKFAAKLARQIGWSADAGT